MAKDSEILEEGIQEIMSIGEDAVLINGLERYEIETLATGHTIETSQDGNREIKTESRMFRFTLPNGWTELPRGAKIEYREQTYSLINATTGIFGNVKCTGVLDRVNNVGTKVVRGR